MEKTPFLSIIMPMYNAENYIEDAIKSIQNQKFEDFELIIVNDKSTDNSKEICEQIKEKDARIKIITVEKNGGAGNARNIGIQLAIGTYITFMDADDIIDFDLYYNAYQKIVQYDVDEVVWGMTEEYYDQNGQCYLLNKLNLPETICVDSKQVRDMVIILEEKTLFGYQCNRFYRADIIKKNNIKFEKVILYEDYFFNLEVIKHVKSMAVIEDVGYHYMKRPNDSITTRYVPEYFDLSKRRIGSLYQLYCFWNQDSTKVRNILGERYLRYILAGLMKSYDKKSKLVLKQRKQWLINVTEEKLYLDIVENCKTNQTALRMFLFMLQKKWWLGALLLGWGVWVIKEKLPIVFNKIRIYK